MSCWGLLQSDNSRCINKSYINGNIIWLMGIQCTHSQMVYSTVIRIHVENFINVNIDRFRLKWILDLGLIWCDDSSYKIVTNRWIEELLEFIVQPHFDSQTLSDQAHLVWSVFGGEELFTTFLNCFTLLREIHAEIGSVWRPLAIIQWL